MSEPTKKKEYSLDDYKIETVEQAKKYLRNNFEDGCKCPCCDQYVKIYKRKLMVKPIKLLVSLYKMNRGYHHVYDMSGEKVTTGLGDFAKIKYWGLIEEKPNTDEKKRTSGYWKITQKGVDFIEGKISVPKYVLIYNAKKYGVDDEKTITITDILENFNYKELMNNE